jgi:hypothetical protein
MTAGLLVNPSSGRRSGRGLALAQRLSGAAGVRAATIERFSELPAILQGFASADVDTLFISAGDGTVHAVQTELAERSPFAKTPRLALLPHGTTNMTAADLGFRVSGIERQAALITQFGLGRRPTSLKTRPTVRVANPADGRVRHGMFLGTGALWRATQFCQERVHALGLKGDWATSATLVTGLARAVFSRTARGDEDRLDRPHAMHICADGRAFADGFQVLFFVTTLDRLILGTRPFWGGATAPLRATAIAHPPPNLLRHLLPVLFGGEDRRLPEQCRSIAAHKIAVETRCPFVIDGEFFAPPESEPLRIETGTEFTYVCG